MQAACRASRRAGGQVGHPQGVPPAVCGLEQGQLGARVRAFAPAAEVLAARQDAAAGAFAAAARGLPRDIAAFTGRQAELAQLMGTLAAVAAGGGVVGIHAIDGMAGIGKPAPAICVLLT
jgi:hypothetical protein